MNYQQKEVVVDPTPTKKAKASWNVKTIEYFIQTCLEQIYKGEPNETTFTKRG